MTPITGWKADPGKRRADLPPLTERQRVVHLLRRFSPGCTPELVSQVSGLGIEEWLDRQLEGRVEPALDLDRRLESLGSIGLTNAEVFSEYVKPIPADLSAEERRARNRLRNVPSREVRDSVLLHAVYGPHCVLEVAADFLRNHFCVAVDKGAVKYFATEYEREVIRGRCFGAFRGILGASAKHPAMLTYLDNEVSRRPPTKAELKAIEMRKRLETNSKRQGQEASDIAAQRGLNENYARELLELHTLGVDNYYTQGDVEEVARALTGWTIEKGGREPMVFKFHADMHCGDNKRVLHKVIRRDWKDPQQEGEQVLDLLAEHEGTADYLAWKLCRFFVCDDPPEGIVRRVAAAFRKSDGNLAAVYRAIATDPDFFDPRFYGAKFKRPFEFVVSALRVTRADIRSCTGLHKALAAMNENIYLCKDPTGYYDQAEAWLDPGALAVRWKFAKDLVAGRIEGVRVPSTFYAGLEDAREEYLNLELVRRVLPAGVGERTSRVLSARIAEHSGTERSLRKAVPSLVGVLLASPEFQEQ
ncbi:MAG: DUF1800 domain-containing protein [Planctomycetota bacterium]|jgi:uncharacterized protein (DUF1800 family)|nr:DUF1800 domain-containing protein [Planctomycetota bacterium]MDP6763593.1 DUF1800 domain-containing protein [Planctomycetota bacterium]MDP6988458.1 DUF1800 domain-containing protein [Planctomycetota bacterium]